MIGHRAQRWTAGLEIAEKRRAGTPGLPRPGVVVVRVMKTKLGRMLLVGLLVAASAWGQVRSDEENERRVRDYWRRVWGEGDLAAVAEFYDPACKHSDNFSIEKFQRGVRRQRESFPDFRVTVEEAFAVGDRVVCRVTYRGTHTGSPMFRQEPLGNEIEVPGIDIFVFRNGKCVEHHHVADHLDLVLQMGLKLTPQPAAAAAQ